MPQLKILKVASKTFRHSQIHKYQRKQTKKSNGQPTTAPTALSSNFFLPTIMAANIAAETLGVGGGGRAGGGVCEFSVLSWHTPLVKDSHHRAPHSRGQPSQNYHSNFGDHPWNSWALY